MLHIVIGQFFNSFEPSFTESEFLIVTSALTGSFEIEVYKSASTTDDTGAKNIKIFLIAHLRSFIDRTALDPRMILFSEQVFQFLDSKIHEVRFGDRLSPISLRRVLISVSAFLFHCRRFVCLHPIEALEHFHPI